MSNSIMFRLVISVVYLQGTQVVLTQSLYLSRMHQKVTRRVWRYSETGALVFSGDAKGLCGPGADDDRALDAGIHGFLSPAKKRLTSLV